MEKAQSTSHLLAVKSGCHGESTVCLSISLQWIQVAMEKAQSVFASPLAVNSGCQGESTVRLRISSSSEFRLPRRKHSPSSHLLLQWIQVAMEKAQSVFASPLAVNSSCHGESTVRLRISSCSEFKLPWRKHSPSSHLLLQWIQVAKEKAQSVFSSPLSVKSGCQGESTVRLRISSCSEFKLPRRKHSPSSHLLLQWIQVAMEKAQSVFASPLAVNSSCHGESTVRLRISSCSEFKLPRRKHSPSSHLHYQWNQVAKEKAQSVFASPLAVNSSCQGESTVRLRISSCSEFKLPRRKHSPSSHLLLQWIQVAKEKAQSVFSSPLSVKSGCHGESTVRLLVSSCSEFKLPRRKHSPSSRLLLQWIQVAKEKAQSVFSSPLAVNSSCHGESTVRLRISSCSEFKLPRRKHSPSSHLHYQWNQVAKEKAQSVFSSPLAVNSSCQGESTVRLRISSCSEFRLPRRKHSPSSRLLYQWNQVAKEKAQSVFASPLAVNSGCQGESTVHLLVSSISEIRLPWRKHSPSSRLHYQWIQVAMEKAQSVFSSPLSVNSGCHGESTVHLLVSSISEIRLPWRKHSPSLHLLLQWNPIGSSCCSGCLLGTRHTWAGDGGLYGKLQRVTGALDVSGPLPHHLNHSFTSGCIYFVLVVYILISANVPSV